MDTCFLLTEIDKTRCDSALEMVRSTLSRYRLSETRYSSKDGIEDYRRAMAAHEASWVAYMRTGQIQVESGDPNPYEWMRFGGLFDLAEREHIIHFFLFPVSSNTAAVAVGFWSSIYDAIYSERSPLECVIDQNARQAFLDLLLMIVDCFSPEAFALKSVKGVEDYGFCLKVVDVQNWLLGTGPTAMRPSWGPQLGGVRKALIDRARLDARGISPTLSETSSGYVVRSLIGVD